MATIVYGDIQDRFAVGVNNCWVTAKDDITGIEYYDADADGNYSITVADVTNNYTVKVWHSGYVIESRTIAVTSGTFNQCDFIPYATPPSYNLEASIEGTVQDDDGNAVENAFVWVESPTKWYGCKTNSSGEYALPIHTAETYDIMARKTNFDERSYGIINQTGYHPGGKTTRDFTGANCLSRILGTVDLGFAVYGRSVVIPDDLPTTLALIAADTPATNTVLLKTRKFDTGAALATTTSGGSDSSEWEGSGGTDYSGTCGDCGD